MKTAAGFAALMIAGGHLVRGQGHGAGGGVGLTHADVDVGVDGVGAAGRRHRIVGDDDLGVGAAGRGQPPRVVHDLRIRLVALRRGDGDAHAHRGAGQQQRVDHVVAVAEIGDLAPGEAAEGLLHRQQVAERLHRVAPVGEPVEDGHR